MIQNVAAEGTMSLRSERGSLALEQVLFIGAIVTMSLGLFAFYDNLSSYFRNFNIASLPTSPVVPGSSSSAK